MKETSVILLFAPRIFGAFGFSGKGRTDIRLDRSPTVLIAEGSKMSNNANGKSFGSKTVATLGMAVLSVFMEKGFWPYAAVIAIVIIIKHRANIKRLIHGEEPPISFKK